MSNVELALGYVPPGARTEELGVDVPIPRGLQCEEIRVKSDKGVTLHGILARREPHGPPPPVRKIVVLYLQGKSTNHIASMGHSVVHAGNAGNPLARLPVFDTLLKGVRQASRSPHTTRSPALIDVSILAVAPRSYWKSSRRTPTQRGLLADYTSALTYATHQYPDADIVLYGHSLGGAVAVCLAASLDAAAFSSVKGLILENPFASIGGMVQALYPQRWLPYRYLAPLAFDRWDALAAVRNMSKGSLLARLARNALVLLSEKDEVVPTSMGMQLHAAMLEKVGLEGAEAPQSMCRQVVIRGALHEHAWTQRQWAQEMVAYLHHIADTKETQGS